MKNSDEKNGDLIFFPNTPDKMAFTAETRKPKIEK
jgi:hypothetical protein